MSTFPNVRLRRLRQSAELRSMLATPMPGPEKFMWPVFVKTGSNLKEPIDSMPGQYRWTVDRLPEAMDALLEEGVKSVLVFGLPDACDKDATGSAALKPRL